MPYKDKIKALKCMDRYREAHKEEIKKRDSKYRMENKDAIKERSKKDYILHSNKRLKYRKEHIEEKREYDEKYRADNKSEKKGYDRNYYLNNKNKINKYLKEYSREKSKTDLRFNLNGRISSGIYDSLEGNKSGRHWEKLVGYTLEDLIKHLKKNIPKGYSMEDCFNGKLHIDHKIPKSVFNFTKPEHIDFKKCWALSNLQLLPAKENMEKGSKLDRPFQPALKIIKRR